MRMIRAHALYFLAFFYCRANDHFTAKNKLEECISIRSNTKIDKLAKELLQNLFDNQIKLPWWRWWLTATSRSLLWYKRLIFIFLVTTILLVVALLVLHPIIFTYFPSYQQVFDANIYLFIIGLVIALILLPSVEQIKTKDIEVKIQTPTPLEFLPSSATMEDSIKDVSETMR